MAEDREVISSRLELISSDYEVFSIAQLLHGAEALILIFTPHTYGDVADDSIESLILEVNARLDEFVANDLRVAVVTRELPNVTGQWMSDRNLRLEVFSDPSLAVSNALVGSFDLSLYLLATKGVQLGSHFVSMPAVAAISGDGSVTFKAIGDSSGNRCCCPALTTCRECYGRTLLF